MRKLFAIKGALAAWVLVFVVSACATTTTSTPATTSTKPLSTTAPAQTTTSAPSGTLNVAVASFTDEAIDPVKGNVSSVHTLSVEIFDPLVNMGANGTLAPWVAEKWDMAADGLSWTFNIRKGVKFHDGSALTAKDVKFSVERYMAKGSYYADMGKMVSRVELVDDYTVRVYTNGSQFLLAFALIYPYSQGMIMPKDYTDKNGADSLENKPVGSGPFKFVSRARGDSVTYESNTGYWQSPPAFKTLNMILIPEETTRMAALKTGSVDIIDASIDGAKDLDATKYKTATLDTISPAVNFMGAYDPRGADLPIANIKVRQALIMAINKEEVRKTLFFGKAAPPGPAFLPANASNMDHAYWNNSAAQIYRYDPTEAKRLLSEAGYANGFTLKLYSSAQPGASFLPDLAEIIQSYWSKIGVRAQIIPIDYGAFKNIRNLLTSQSTDVLGASSLSGVSSSPDTVGRLSGPYESTGYFALLGKAFPQFDKLLNSARTERDVAKRKDILAQAIKMATDTYVGGGIARVPSLVALGPKVDLEIPAEGGQGIGLWLGLSKQRK